MIPRYSNSRTKTFAVASNVADVLQFVNDELRAEKVNAVPKITRRYRVTVAEIDVQGRKKIV